MVLCEIKLMSAQVKKMADFYKKLLQIGSGNESDLRQELVKEPVRLVIENDGAPKTNNNTNIGLVFSCEDIDKEYERLKSLKVHFIEKPHEENGKMRLSFYDPDGNHVFFTT